MSIARIDCNHSVGAYNYKRMYATNQIKASNVSFKGNDTKDINDRIWELSQREDIRNAKDYIRHNIRRDMKMDEQSKNVLESAKHLLENGIRPTYKHGYTEARKGTLLEKGLYGETFNKLFDYCASEHISMDDFINLASTIVVDPNSKDYNLETANKLLEITKAKGLNHGASFAHPLSCLINVSDNEKSDKLSGKEFIKILNFAMKKDVGNKHLEYLLDANSPKDIKSGKISIKDDKLVVFDDSKWGGLSNRDCSPRERKVYINGKLSARYGKENQWADVTYISKYNDNGKKDYSISCSSKYAPQILYYNADGQYVVSEVPADKKVKKEDITKVYKTLTSSGLADVADDRTRKYFENATKDFVDTVKETYGIDLEKSSAAE